MTNEESTIIQTSETHTSPLARMAVRYGTTKEALRKVCESICFKPDKEGRVPPDELKLAFYLVCESLDMNPLRREIFCLYDHKKGTVNPYVSIDGWLRKANDHPQFDGLSCTIDGYQIIKRNGKDWRVPTGATCTLWRKDRSHPVIVQESWDENFRENQYCMGPWYDRPERMMKKCPIIQACRMGLSFSGIMSEEDAYEAVENGRREDVALLTEREQGADRVRNAIVAAEQAKAERTEAGRTDAPTAPVIVAEVVVKHETVRVRIEPCAIRTLTTRDKKKAPYLSVDTTDRETFMVYRTSLFDLFKEAAVKQGALMCVIERGAVMEAEKADEVPV